MNRFSPLLRGLRHWGLPPVLGALSVFGFAPVHLFPLPILCIALLFASVLHNPERVFARAFLFGLGWFLAGVYWVYISLHDMGQLPAPIAVAATLGFSMLLALFPALALWLAARAEVGERWRWLVLAPILWALMEWLRGWLLTGFPWQAVGYSQVPWSPLAGYAPILGVYGVSWLAALSAGFLALRWRAGWLLLAAFWLAGYALQRVEWTHPVGAPISVSMVQGNISQETKFLPEKLAETLAMYRQKVGDRETRLVILLETDLPACIEERPKWFLEELAEPMRARGGDLITGIAEMETGERYYNSMISLGASPQQRFRIQIARGFIREENQGIVDHGPGKLRPPLHPS